MKFPKKLGECIDLAYHMRTERLELEKQAADMEAERRTLVDHIILSFNKTELDGAKGKMATATILTKTSAKVADFDAFRTWVIKSQAWEFLWRAANLAACKEAWDEGKTVPGVERFDKIDLSLTKVK